MHTAIANYVNRNGDWLPTILCGNVEFEVRKVLQSAMTTTEGVSQYKLFQFNVQYHLVP